MVVNVCTSLKNRRPDTVVKGTMLNINIADMLAGANLNPNVNSTCPINPKVHMNTKIDTVEILNWLRYGAAGISSTNDEMVYVQNTTVTVSYRSRNFRAAINPIKY